MKNTNSSTRFLLVCAIFSLSIFNYCKKGGKAGYDPKAGSGTENTLTASAPLLKLLPAEQTGLMFANIINETHVNNITNNIFLYNGGGLAVGDINNDGLQDIYFVNANGKNALYLNQGGLKFKDITDAAKVGSEDGFETAVTMADVNADGFLDIYVCRAGVEQGDARRNQLFVNNGNLTFTSKAAEFGLDNASPSTGANFFDYDLDGDLDLYLLNYPPDAGWANRIEAKRLPDGKYEPFMEPQTELDSDRLYRNDGDGKFTDVTKQAGVWRLAYGLSVSVSDFNRDGWPDIYVGNDFVQPDFLYINNQDGTFTNRLGQYVRHTSQHTMGVDLTDFDNDGYPDIFAVDMLPANHYRQKSLAVAFNQSKYTAMIQAGYFEPVVRNVLQRNNGNGTFSDIACLSGVYKTDWSWSGLLFDMDNDGLRDLHVTNGYRRETVNKDFIDFFMPDVMKQKSEGKSLRDIFPDLEILLGEISVYKPRNFCFQNKGDWTFADVSGQWMTIPASWSCGSAWADFDNDGDLDLVANNLEEPCFFYENTAAGKPGSNFLQAKLQGPSGNRFGVGASMMVYAGGKLQFAEMNPSRGIFSGVENLFHFGLGEIGQAEKVVVRWPDGKSQTLTNVKANQRLTLDYGDASDKIAALQPPVPASTIFKDKTEQAGINFLHVENPFNDFEQFPLNPFKISDLGPVLTKGDANGDGLEDFFIGNAFGQQSGLFAQQPNGSFKPLSEATWKSDAPYEDLGAVFFDADGDRDADLFVVSGGAEVANPPASQCRLYINMDGKGTYHKVSTGVPPTPDAGMRAAAFDFDGDGDEDVFLGGRATPAQWPLTPRSVVLRNDRNKFTDVTTELAPEFERCGMVTDLAWANLDGDPAPELLVCGEFMPIMVFKNMGGHLQNATAQFGLEKTNGLWHRLGVGDLDGDGDFDLVGGNFGLNSRIVASENGPLRCYAKDFDNNGTLDPIMAYFENGKEYPFVQKEVMTKHMPALKKKLLYARDYAAVTIDGVWPRKDLDAALTLNCYMLESCWFENRNGKFVKHVLPIQAQTSVNQGVVIDDFTGDNHPDILLAGNKYGIEVETNRMDAGNGTLLASTGLGDFRWVNNLESGFWATRQARDLALLRGPGGKKLVVVSFNNDRVKVFEK